MRRSKIVVRLKRLGLFVAIPRVSFPPRLSDGGKILTSTTESS